MIRPQLAIGEENTLPFAIKPPHRIPIFPQPQTFDDLFLEDAYLKRLKYWFSNLSQLPPALLLHAPAGHGKTTIPRVLMQQQGFIPHCDHFQMFESKPEDTKVLYLNGADKNGGSSKVTEMLRQALNVFFTVTSQAARTIIFVDEAHNLSDTAKDMLKPACEYLHQRDGGWGVGGHVILLSVDKTVGDDQLMSRCIKFDAGKVDRRKVLRYAAKNLIEYNVECDLKTLGDIYDHSIGVRDFLLGLYYMIEWNDLNDLSMGGRLLESL